MFWDAFNEGGILPDGIDIPETVKQGAAIAAAQYAVNRGLIVPLRSSIYRDILEVGEKGGAVLLLSDIYAKIVDGGRAEFHAFKEGACH